MSRRSEELLRDTRKMKREITKSTALTELFVTVFVLLTVAVGIVLVRFDVVSTGKMILGVTTVFGSFGPVIALSALPGNLTHTFAAGDRVLDLLVEKPVVCDVRGGKDIEFDNLEVKDLDFSYDGSVRVLDGVNFRVGKGEIVGLVGESGCGKSTLLKLLLRFWERDGGVINYNGTDIDAINSESLLQNVTLVSQNTWLFDESIEDNLRIAKPDATREELEKPANRLRYTISFCRCPTDTQPASARWATICLPEKTAARTCASLSKRQRTYSAGRADEQRGQYKRRHNSEIACRTERKQKHNFGFSQRIHHGNSRQNLQSGKRSRHGGKKLIWN